MSRLVWSALFSAIILIAQVTGAFAQAADGLSFEPVRYRPIPVMVGGLRSNTVLLDGTWRINQSPADSVRSETLDSAGWKDFKVPGQFKQQGFCVDPKNIAVTLAREFEVPSRWKGHRVFLRFDAIHAGVTYWLNGKKLGYSENLFTPVEWEITDGVTLGAKNRLDLHMETATVSEKLSISSDYAMHNLGGIDRSVRIYALPNVNIRAMRVVTDLDSNYQNAKLDISFTLDNAGVNDDSGLSLDLSLRGAKGKSVLSKTFPVTRGAQTINISADVTDPLKWSAEKPNLYKLTIDLKRKGNLLERVERSIGFRKIEIRPTEATFNGTVFKSSQIYLNGKLIKLAGSCHHEIDPLTGRADTARHAEGDIKMLKQANLNYTRTSHYPPTMEFVEAANRLGMYLEVEAPFCWVGEPNGMDSLKHYLTPTSAMVDYYNSDPSVIIWSIANESGFNPAFEESAKMVKRLDPTRLTTFNGGDPKEICDLANAHYPPMPYDAMYPQGARPWMIDEYNFPICHEKTDVDIDPGLRELWGAGHANPDSDFSKEHAKSYQQEGLKPGTPPGTWSYVIASKRIAGTAIWASIDDSFYFSDGTHAGFSWVHGYWGLIDAWRRPKPEWWLSKLIFTPVWFPVRRVDFTPDQKTIVLPVENRYSFTDLADLNFTWEFGWKTGKLRTSVAPMSKGELKIPVPQGAATGDKIVLRVTNSKGELVNTIAVHLGKDILQPVPQPSAGAPKWSDDGNRVVIQGNKFSLVFNKSKGELSPNDPEHKSAILKFPAVHITRCDFGALGPDSLGYAVLPNAATRVVDKVTVQELSNGLEIKVSDHYEDFAGSVTWLIDKNGTSSITTDYVHSGKDLNAREIGVKSLARLECDQLDWRRWSEWDIFPKDSISRTEGRAKARRGSAVGRDQEHIPPTWVWALNQTERGTNDFRGIKFNIYQASLTAPDGSGVRANSNADAHFRASLTTSGVEVHVLSKCMLGQTVIKTGDRINGHFILQLLGPRRK